MHNQLLSEHSVSPNQTPHGAPATEAQCPATEVQTHMTKMMG